METSPSGKQDELALHVLHSLDQPICILDAGDCFIFANKAYAANHGLGPERLRGTPIRQVIGEEFYQRRIRVLLERARAEGRSEYRGWVEYAEAGRRNIVSEIRRYTYPGLADENCLMIQVRDITDRVELDHRRRKSLDRQAELMAGQPAMLWIAGKDGIPYFYNESWLNFTGCTLVEQMRHDWRELIAAEDRQLVEDRLAYAMENGESVNLEFRLQHAWGGYRWVRMSGRHLQQGGDFLVSCLDIDDLMRQDCKLRADLEEARHLRDQALVQKAAADRANREKSAYLSLASHEIRTPMNPVIGFADLLASNPDLDGDSKEMAQMILKAGKNLLTLIDEVLDFAKIEAGVLKLDPEPVDVHDLLLEVDNLYAFDAKSRGIELKITDHVQVKEELFEDRLRLQQILGTLIGNAIKFTHTGEVEVIAESETVGANGHKVDMLKFIVRDTGVGMDEEELDKLFKPFARPENEFTDKYAGAGLGLAIAQKLVEAMNGTIDVHSEVGTGTEVKLVIPYTPVPEHLRPALTRHEEESPEQPTSARQANILVVDDEESSRQVNVSLLRFLGYASDTARNGEELMAKLRERSYSMILMDIMMPGMDGFEATRRIRNGDCGEGNREAYIVAVTVCSEEEDRELGRKAGINAYLTKPLTIHALRETIGEYHSLGHRIA